MKCKYRTELKTGEGYYVTLSAMHSKIAICIAY